MEPMAIIVPTNKWVTFGQELIWASFFYDLGKGQRGDPVIRVTDEFLHTLGLGAFLEGYYNVGTSMYGIHPKGHFKMRQVDLDDGNTAIRIRRDSPEAERINARLGGSAFV